jgi:hypothetical protein
LNSVGGYAKTPILRLLRRGWLEPIRADDLFELYTLIRILELLRGELGFGEPTHVGLIKNKREQIALFKRNADSMKAEVYFDQSPIESLQINSMYKSVMESYDGVTGIARRPDILIRFSLPGSDYERRLFIECKRSEDDGYTRDSVYKALGYLKDFSDAWSVSPDQVPKIIVAFPRILVWNPTAEQLRHELVLACADDNRHLTELFSMALG